MTSTAATIHSVLTRSVHESVSLTLRKTAAAIWDQARDTTREEFVVQYLAYADSNPPAPKPRAKAASKKTIPVAADLATSNCWKEPSLAEKTPAVSWVSGPSGVAGDDASWGREGRDECRPREESRGSEQPRPKAAAVQNGAAPARAPARAPAPAPATNPRGPGATAHASLSWGGEEKSVPARQGASHTSGNWEQESQYGSAAPAKAPAAKSAPAKAAPAKAAPAKAVGGWGGENQTADDEWALDDRKVGGGWEEDRGQPPAPSRAGAGPRRTGAGWDGNGNPAGNNWDAVPDESGWGPDAPLGSAVGAGADRGYGDAEELPGSAPKWAP